MKYKLLFVFILLQGIVFAQQLPNSSFEQWDTIGPYSQPTDWFTINELIIEGVAQSTVLTNDAYNGNYAALLKTVSTSFGTNLSGFLATGSLLDNNYNISLNNIKIPYTYRPQTWEFYYKYLPANKDTGIALFVLTKWNVSKKKPDTVAVAAQFFADSISTYTKVSLPFNYSLPLFPDSAFVLISPNLKNNPPVGTAFYIDALNVSGNVTSVEDVDIKKSSLVTLYPNPAHNDFQIKTDATISMVVIKEMTGKVISETKGNKSISTAELPNGIYIIECISENNIIVTHKLIIQHP